MADVTITFTNYSKVAFVRGYWGLSPSVVDTGGVNENQSPGDTLQSESGSQIFAVSKTLSTFLTGDYDMYCMWADPKTGMRFGVCIHVPVQVATFIGTAPNWFVAYDNKGTVNLPPDWLTSGSDPSDPYTWPSSVGLNIVATPTAGGSTLTVDVMIQDL